MALTAGKLYKAMKTLTATVDSEIVVIREDELYLGESVPAALETIFVAEGLTPKAERAAYVAAGLNPPSRGQA